MVNNTVLYTKNLLRGKSSRVKGSYHNKNNFSKKLPLFGEQNDYCDLKKQLNRH